MKWELPILFTLILLVRLLRNIEVMAMNPMEHLVRLPQILARLQQTPDKPVCCFLQMMEDGSFAPDYFVYCRETGLYGQRVAIDKWLWRTADEMEDLYGDDYWLLIPGNGTDS